jgi:hypothetical protein
MSHKYSTGQNVYYECHSNIRLVGKHAKFRDAVHGPDFYEKIGLSKMHAWFARRDFW